ncbi:hypothetical protein [Cupriavidus taiwanensis]|uniref:hypothetical protein n=1 Tax=Cupriavidus taiwanensis TaxID=164546 RepID=UPI000E123997|nr:hypothetical protein [Cupriavidus taiwanensis]SPA17257.1 conserved hypothetical protein [Cupriavidus taiwanensis]
MQVPNVAQEQVETKHLGTVTVRGMTFNEQSDYMRTLKALGDDADPNDVSFALISRVARFNGGEAMTRDEYGAMPAYTARDIALIITTAKRLNGLDGDEVEKA